MRIWRKAVLGAGIALAMSSAALAFPDRPINFIVAYNAGGATDLAARTMAPFIEKYLGGSIVVINRPGAGGELGFTEVARADPDGYTIGFMNMPPLITMPIERDTQYSLDSFEFIANIVDDPDAVAVAADSEFESVEDIVSYAKEHPGELSYGTTGVGSDDHLAALAWEREAGIELKHVPFSGGSEVRQALIGGHIDLGVYNLGVMIGEARDGLVRPLGMMADERWDAAPDVPTFKELGYDVVQGSARGIGGPAGMPEEVVEKLAAAIEKTVQDPEFQEFARNAPMALRYMAPADYNDFVNAENERYKALWDDQPWN